MTELRRLIDRYPAAAHRLRAALRELKAQRYGGTHTPS
jgi:hypothetical protein